MHKGYGLVTSGGGASLLGFIAMLMALLRPGSGIAAEDFDCLINPSKRIEVSSPVTGILSEVLVDKGDRVEKGQTLARLESSVERADFRMAMEKAEYLQREVARNQDLYARDLMSTHDKDQMETDSRKAQIELGRVSALLKRRSLDSPISGYVIERHHDPGEYVGTEPVFDIVALQPLHVDVILPVRMLGRVRKGMVATIRPQPPVGGQKKATVDIVDRVVDAASGTFSVRLLLDNPDHLIPAGIKCKVSFPGE